MHCNTPPCRSFPSANVLATLLSNLALPASLCPPAAHGGGSGLGSGSRGVMLMPPALGGWQPWHRASCRTASSRAR
eukprot:gene15580-biopygen17190